MRFIVICALISATTALTCYNGMKLLRSQDVGTSTEECSSGSYCYNMTSSALLVVDMVKAGCSKWRCMLAREGCMRTYIDMVPVSICCCSYDRCNVGGNPVFDSNPQQITGGNSGSGGNNNQGGSGYNYGGDNNNQNNKGGSGYDYNYGSGGSTNNNNNQNKGGSNYDYNYGSGTNSGSSNGKKFSQKEIEDKFRDFDIEKKDDRNGGDVEPSFQKVDAWTTPGPANRGGSQRQGEQGKEIEI